MQDLIDTKRAELGRLKLKLHATEAERDRIQREVQALEASLTKSASGLWSRATLATVSVLAVASLLSASVFHDAQSSVKQNSQSDLPVYAALETGQIERVKHSSASSEGTSSQSGKNRTKRDGKKVASQRQWGPSLVMNESGASKGPSGFDPLVKEQQANLLTLGFELGKADGYKGARTRQAIAEFRALYLPDNAKQLKDADLGVIIENYANLARSDAAKFGIDHGIVAAIRLSSVRTGVNFSYLMKLAATESNFKPGSESATSSATGMYQFTRDTWLNVIKTYGPKYGLVGDYAEAIDYYLTRSGYQRPIVRDKATYQHLLALRKNPRLSAIMAAEMVRDNQQKLLYSFDREPTEADLYLTHFLGTDAAIDFLRSLEHNPEARAVELFPRAASSNHDIFHPKTCKPRTVDEVYALFDRKLKNRRYDDFADN
jgi:hypothetical protein